MKIVLTYATDKTRIEVLTLVHIDPLQLLHTTYTSSGSTVILKPLFTLNDYVISWKQSKSYISRFYSGANWLPHATAVGFI